jgi:hypothetical protein
MVLIRVLCLLQTLFLLAIFTLITLSNLQSGQNSTADLLDLVTIAAFDIPSTTDVRAICQV